MNKNKTPAKLLFEKHMSLVIKQIRRYQSLPSDILEDLKQAGFLALWEAIQTFDPKKGCAFSTYAWERIHKAISTEFRDNLGPIHLTEYACRKAMDNVGSKQGGNYGCNPVTQLPRYLSIEAVDREYDLDGSEPMNFRPTTEEILTSLSVDERDSMDLKLDAEKILSSLTEDERELIQLCFGFGEEEYTLRDIGQLLGISRTLVQKRRRKAIAKLRRHFQDNKD